ncbi:acetyl-CoA synthetase [Perkinsela sp. CCAP 1560/4]|nr:acetyl-CoA synthetase [Perkinsela sp. CCAP 1560/4]|eukprot:KNH08232.1 acetyl-CoA synthetase [Perkinsela sp. CCAP 1560/4]
MLLRSLIRHLPRKAQDKTIRKSTVANMPVERTAAAHRKHLASLLHSLLRLKNVKKRPSRSLHSAPHTGNKERKGFITVLQRMRSQLVGRRHFKMINDSLLRPMPAFYRQFIKQCNEKIIANLRKG